MELISTRATGIPDVHAAPGIRCSSRFAGWNKSAALGSRLSWRTKLESNHSFHPVIGQLAWRPISPFLVAPFHSSTAVSRDSYPAFTISIHFREWFRSSCACQQEIPAPWPPLPPLAGAEGADVLPPLCVVSLVLPIRGACHTCIQQRPPDRRQTDLSSSRPSAAYKNSSRVIQKQHCDNLVAHYVGA